MTLPDDKKGTPDLRYMPAGTDYDDYDGPFFLVAMTDFKFEAMGEIYHDLIGNKEFYRLTRIRQLGTVGVNPYSMCQDQDRGFHCMAAAAMMDIVLYRNGFGDHERKLGIAAGMYHDLAIMPYSDQGKLLDPKCLEEELLVRRVMRGSKNIRDALSKHRLDLDEVVEAIQGKGIVGMLLNSREGIDIDNISYLMIDRVWSPYTGTGFCINRRGFRLAYTKDFTRGMQDGTFEQYNNLRFMDGEWVFDNPRLLVNLLRFRAEMYKRVYHHPYNRAKEAFLARELKNYRLEFEAAIKMTDEDFERWFEKTLGHESSQAYLISTFPRFRVARRCYDLSKLDAMKSRLEDENNIVEKLKPPRDAIRNLVLYRKNVRWLEDIPKFREEVDAVRRMIRRLDYVGIFERIPEEEQGRVHISENAIG